MNFPPKFRNLFQLVLGAIAGSLLFIGCQVPVGGPEKSTVRETAVVGGKTVILASGVASIDLGLSYDDKVKRITDKLSLTLGRIASGSTESPLSDSEINGVLQTSIEQLSLPNFEAPEKKDFDRVHSDFPGLSDEQIAEKWLEIRGIYLDELAALCLNNMVTSVSSSRALSRATYVDNGTFKFGSTELTVFELAVMVSYPLSALSLNATRDKAFELTANYMACDPQLTNEKSDAFRHGVWSETLAKMGWGYKDEKMNWAILFTGAHELGTKYNSTGKLSSDMDWHNNTVGLEYYGANAQKTYSSFTLWWLFGSTTWTWESGVSEPSYEQIAGAIRQKAKAAVFVNRDIYDDAGGRSRITSESGKLVYLVPDSKVYP